MPISTAPYRRKYSHTKSRGKERVITCGVCGREVPRWKTFFVNKRFTIRDPVILQQVDRRMIHLLNKKMRVCPSCARFWKISQPGKSVRKKHMRK